MLPDKVPVKTAPRADLRVIVLPIKLPWTWRGLSGGGDRMNVPSSPLADFVNVRVQKPLGVLLHVLAPFRSDRRGAESA